MQPAENRVEKQVNAYVMNIPTYFIVEDNVFYASILKTKIENIKEANVEIFSRAEDCLKEIHKLPKVIFLDHNLPDNKGLDVLKKVKSRFPTIQVVMVSGEATVSVAINCLKYGATDYLLKGKDDNHKKLTEVLEDCETLCNRMILNNRKYGADARQFLNLLQQ